MCGVHGGHQYVSAGVLSSGVPYTGKEVIMAQKSTPSGTHAVAYAEVLKVLVSEEESILADGKLQARAEGLSVVAKAVDAVSRRHAHKTSMKSLPKRVDELYKHLEDAVKVQEWGHMRRNIDQVLSEEHPWFAENLAILKELEAQLNDNFVTDSGVKVSQLPPNHPLMQEIRDQKQALAEMRKDSLAALDELIHFAGIEYADALEADRLVNTLWKAYKSGRERK
jgi:hypothetical protein